MRVAAQDRVQIARSEFRRVADRKLHDAGDAEFAELLDEFRKLLPLALGLVAGTGRGIYEAKVAAQRARQEPRDHTRAVGRNDPCPCGSGRKFKNCCLGH